MQSNKNSKSFSSEMLEPFLETLSQLNGDILNGATLTVEQKKQMIILGQFIPAFNKNINNISSIEEYHAMFRNVIFEDSDDEPISDDDDEHPSINTRVEQMHISMDEQNYLVDFINDDRPRIPNFRNNNLNPEIEPINISPAIFQNHLSENQNYPSENQNNNHLLDISENGNKGVQKSWQIKSGDSNDSEYDEDIQE